ncbi:hypothetical protein [Pseudoalteromonas sp. H103]|uniref:hypothetical protein n=2 Tax=unclassified Pseudoalteromonas TaxID=194690 RepID=UPI00137A3E59|nr:hypothetical protein [Pseudoalteromonas sp. H103]
MMKIYTLLLLAIFLQPFCIYFALYAKAKYSSENKPINQLVLGVTPSLAYLSADDFWGSFVLLFIVTAGSLLLSLLLNLRYVMTRKVNTSTILTSIVSFLLVFGFFYWLIGHFIVENWYETFLPSFYFLGLLVSVFIIKIIEKKRQIEDGLSNMLVLALCVAASVISAFGDAFLLCTCINIFLLIPIGGAIISSDVDKTSAGGIAFFYGYVFIMSLPLSGLLYLALSSS